jgi:hypothetical protein
MTEGSRPWHPTLWLFVHRRERGVLSGYTTDRRGRVVPLIGLKVRAVPSVYDGPAVSEPDTSNGDLYPPAAPDATPAAMGAAPFTPDPTPVPTGTPRPTAGAPLVRFAAELSPFAPNGVLDAPPRVRFASRKLRKAEAELLAQLSAPAASPQ